MLVTLCISLSQLIAVFDKVKRGRTDSPRDNMSNYSSGAPSPEPLHYHSHLQFLESNKGEIEVNEAVLKASRSHLLQFYLGFTGKKIQFQR